ncbi:MAG: hypothetical protein WKF81_02385 [Thermomicrobiales bacterium]
MVKHLGNNVLRRCVRFGSISVLSLSIAACGMGGEDDEENDPTATIESEIESQSTQTVAPTSVPTEEGTPESAFMLIPGTPESDDIEATPEDAEGTPVATVSEVVEDERPTVDSTPLATGPDPDETPQAPEDEETSAPEEESASAPTETPVSGTGSDGTSGSSGAGGLLDNPDATPAPATEEPETGTESSGSELAVVESCDVVEAPPFTGDDPNFVAVEELNFRAGPGGECETLDDVPLEAGTTLTVVSDPVVRSDDPDEITWVQVDVDGDIGWVATEFIEPAE